MLNNILKFSLRHSGAVIAISFMLLAYSFNQLRSAHFDVFPEFAPPQVSVQTEAPGFTAGQVEKLITEQVEHAISGANGVKAVQSYSIQGLSAVDVFFDPDSDVVKGRQVINEQIASLASSFPAGVKAPLMAPLTSTTNNVMGIGLTSDKLSLTELRTIADWEIRPRLLSVKGVSEAERFGGLIRQIQIQVHPDKLVKYGLSLDDVVMAAQKANGISGAGIIDTANQRLTLNSISSGETIDEIRKTPIIRGNAEGIDLAITLADIADVKLGNETPFSAASIMGKPGVLLMVTSQYMANTLEVTRGVEEALNDLKPILEARGIMVWDDLIRPASFIEKSLDNLTSAFYWGAAMVIAVLFLFLLNWRAALISALAIPFSLVMAAAILNMLGFTLNTMTLGGLAVAVGLVVDDAVIGIENILRRMRENKEVSYNKENRFKVLLDASLEVRSPIVIATLAIIIVTIPIITLPGLSGRFFAPLGIAYSLATIISLLVALTITPALSILFLKEKKDSLPKLTLRLQKFYVMTLQKAAGNFKIIFVVIGLMFLISVGLFFSFKDEFLPVLREGHFIVHMGTEPGTSLERSVVIGNEVTNNLLKLPFVDKVFQQIGRTEGGIDIWGTNISEFNVSLKDTGIDETGAQDKIEKTLKNIKDADFEVETFLTERVKEVMSGYTKDASLNIYSGDESTLVESGKKVMELLKTIKGVKGIEQPEQPGMPEIAIKLKADELGKNGLSAVEVLDTIHTAYQGNVVTQIYDSLSSIDVAVILNENNRRSVEQLNDLPVKIPSGEYIKLSEIAEIREKEGNYMITRDGGRRVETITFDVRNRNLSEIVNEIRDTINKQKILSDDTYFTIDSLAEESANSRNDLLIKSIFSAIVVLVLLSFITRDNKQLLIIIISLPFALIGGVLAVEFTGGVLNLGGLVGFLTLFGITVRNSVMLISHYNHLVEHEGKEWNWHTILQGSSERLLPILMTAIVTGIGLLPMVINIKTPGHEIEGPMAIVILGGLISSTTLNLFILPLITKIWINKSTKKETHYA